MIHALYAPPGGAVARAIAPSEVGAFLKMDGVVWLDLQDASEGEREVLSKLFGFHPIAIEDCIADAKHPKVDNYGEYVYLVVHGVKPSAERGRLHTEEVDFFLGKSFVVTHHRGAVAALEEVRRRSLEIPGSVPSADLLLYAMLDRLADTYVEKMESLDGEIDGLEQRLFRRGPAGRAVLAEIFALKKEVLQLKRMVNPQREVMNRFVRGEFAVIGKGSAPHFRNVYDHVYRVSEMVESFRDVVTSALETYLTVVANRTNEVMKVLTVLSAILMSVSLIAGIYGMNFAALPFKDAAWGFWGCLGLMAAVAGVMLFLFRRRRWV